MESFIHSNLTGWLFGSETIAQFAHFCAHLVIATALGGALGAERQFRGHCAGVRTHMMVALGAAIFTLAAIATAGDSPNEVTRVIQGIAAGIGFVGAGTILKLSNEREVRGLTTASSIWLAAALGTVAGMGEYALAAAAGVVSIFIMGVLRPVTKPLWNDRPIVAPPHWDKPTASGRPTTPPAGPVGAPLTKRRR